MKKFIALLLAMVMVFALAACGGSAPAEVTADEPAEVPGEATVDEGPAGPAEDAPAEEGPADAAPAEEPSGEPGGSGEPSGSDGPSGEAVDDSVFEVLYPDAEPLSITFNSSYNENETGGIIATHFKKALEGITGGAITVNISYGGTLFTPDDELDACGDGAINMMIFGHTRHTSELPVLCAIPDFAPESVQNAIDYFKYVMADPEAGAAIEAEAEAYGIKYLSVNSGSANYFVADHPFENLTDMIEKCAAFGNAAPAKFEALGLNVEMSFPWDYYNDFSTGKIDTTQMDGPAMYSMSLYEVAPYWMSDGTFAAGNFITVNLDWWNGLTDAQREAIQAAADDTSAWSVEFNQAEYEKLDANLIANGATIVEMTDEEFDTWWSAIFETAAGEARAIAADNGNAEDVEAVLKAAAEYTGYDLA